MGRVFREGFQGLLLDLEIGGDSDSGFHTCLALIHLLYLVVFSNSGSQLLNHLFVD
jgi:hypothetical protein